MVFIRAIYGLFVGLFSMQVFAAESASSAGIGMFKVLLGLGLVLAVLAGFAWLMKKMGMHQYSANAVAKVVGGVSVGQRERLVVVEVANRWLVVGVTPNQITQIANLDPVLQAIDTAPSGAGSQAHGAQQAFGQWLQKAMQKKS